MEEDKKIKFKKNIKMACKSISYTIICVLMIISIFIIFYVISGSIAKKQDKKSLFGLYTIISPSMTGTLNVYDVAFTVKVNPDLLKENDIITFNSTNSFYGGVPITHRITQVIDIPGEEKMFVVKGDANIREDEEKVLASNVLGKVIFRFPQLGKIQFFLASKGGWIVAIMIPTLVVISYDIYKIFRLLVLKNKLLSMKNKHGNI